MATLIGAETAPKTLPERMALPEYDNPNNLKLARLKFKDNDTREWRLGKTIKDEWARTREYEYDSPEDCMENGPHEVWPPRWPVAPRVIAQVVLAGPPVKIEVNGTEWVRCEKCGVNVGLTNDMLEDPERYGVRIVLPKPKEKR